MSIQIDNRAGSAQLAPLLRSLGVEVDLTTLPFGDAAWIGWGANGDAVSCGCEVKKIEDVVACIQSGRFAGHQLPGLIASYDHVWLLIIDEYRPRARDGVLEYRKEGRGGGMYWSESCGRQRTVFWRDVESWLMTCQIMGGIRVHQVPDYNSAAMWLKLVSNWFAKEEHKSHRVLYGTKELFADHALLVKPTLARRVAAQLPGIGEKRSAEVARVFHTLEDMVEASPKDWATKVEGVGKGIAAKIYSAIHQNGNGGKR
jgi:ERCC4-type nuclease